MFRRTQAWMVRLLPLMIICCGCEDRLQPRERRAATQGVSEQSSVDSHFVIAMKLLDELDVGLFYGHETRSRITYHLQEWGKRQQANPDWFADPMILRLPSQFNNFVNPKTLPSLRFYPADVTFLVESVMTRDVSNQVMQLELLDHALAKQLESQSANLDSNQKSQLLRAAKLFDWTIRNIQLEPLDPPVPSDRPNNAPPLPSPGARRYAWESILIGKGDAMVRSRVFLLLARQQRIPVIMLGVAGESEVKPWCAAAWIGGQLYLFDVGVGLPIPGPGGVGVATLQQLRETPELLRQMDVSVEMPYGITADDLGRIVALIDAAPEALSQRMTAVEAALTGEQKMVLTTEASSLANELQSARLVLRSEIWTQPYESQLYHLRALGHPETSVVLKQELSTLEGDTPLAVARRLHLRGIYDNDPPRQGARSLYLAARPADRELEMSRNLTDDQLQNELAPRLNVPAEVRQDVNLLRRALDVLREQATQNKQSASYWLGIVAFEHQQFDVAIDYFDKRTLTASPDGAWTLGARYNLARTYELLALRNNDSAKAAQAMELLQQDPKAPQAYGNLLRAARLAGLIAAAQATPSTTPPSNP